MHGCHTFWRFQQPRCRSAGKKSINQFLPKYKILMVRNGACRSGGTGENTKMQSPEAVNSANNYTWAGYAAGEGPYTGAADPRDLQTEAQKTGPDNKNDANPAPVNQTIMQTAHGLAPKNKPQSSRRSPPGPQQAKAPAGKQLAAIHESSAPKEPQARLLSTASQRSQGAASAGYPCSSRQRSQGAASQRSQGAPQANAPKGQQASAPKQQPATLPRGTA